jgi:hypothetical protein
MLVFRFGEQLEFTSPLDLKKFLCNEIAGPQRAVWLGIHAEAHRASGG